MASAGLCLFAITFMVAPQMGNAMKVSGTQEEALLINAAVFAKQPGIDIGALLTQVNQTLDIVMPVASAYGSTESKVHLLLATGYNKTKTWGEFASTLNDTITSAYERFKDFTNLLNSSFGSLPMPDNVTQAISQLSAAKDRLAKAAELTEDVPPTVESVPADFVCTLNKTMQAGGSMILGATSALDSGVDEAATMVQGLPMPPNVTAAALALVSKARNAIKGSRQQIDRMTQVLVDGVDRALYNAPLPASALEPQNCQNSPNSGASGAVAPLLVAVLAVSAVAFL